MADKRKIDRREFTYYMQVTDDATKQLIGYLTDISTGGFKLDAVSRFAEPSVGRRRKRPFESCGG